MDKKLIDEIEKVFADYETTEEIISEGEVRTIFAYDIRLCDIVNVFGNEYVVTGIKRATLTKNKGVKMVLCLRGFGVGAEERHIDININGAELIKTRRIQ